MNENQEHVTLRWKECDVCGECNDGQQHHDGNGDVCAACCAACAPPLTLEEEASVVTGYPYDCDETMWAKALAANEAEHEAIVAELRHARRMRIAFQVWADQQPEEEWVAF